MAKVSMSSAVLVAILLGATFSARAETRNLHDKVELLTGEVFYGRVLRLTDHEVSIQLASGGILSFRRSRVRLVRARGTPQDEEAARRETLRSLYEVGKPLPSDPPSATGTLPSLAPPKPDTSAPPPRTLTVLPPPDERKAKEPAPGAAASLEGAVAVKEHHFSVVPPSGFARILSGDVDGDVVLRYRDPLTDALFIVAAYRTNERLVTLKKRLNKSSLTHFKGYEIRQDVALTNTGYEGWLLEIRTRLGDMTLHQLQLLARAHEDILILTYLATDEHWERYEKAFEKSARSLRVLPRDDAGSSAEIGRASTSTGERAR